MEQFHTAVKNALKRHNITTYKLSEISGIDRSLLVKITKGQRSITPQKLDYLLKFMDLTADEDEEIRLAYIDMNFGINKFNEYSDIFIYDNSGITSDNSDSNAIELSVNFTEPVTDFNSYNELIRSLYAVTAYEAKNDGKKRIYTNLDASITRDLFDSLPKNAGDIDIKQIITADADSDYSKIIKSAVEFMIKGYKIYYSHVNSDISKRADIVFPYYYVTDELCVLTDASMTSGFVAKNKKFADTYAKKISAAANEMKSIVALTQNIMDVKSTMLELIPYSDKTMTSMEFDLCVTFFMTLDMWEQIAKPDVPNRNYLRDTTYEYYQALLHSKKRLFMLHSYEGMEKFTRDGIVFQMPAEYAYPLTLENRAQIYRNLIEYYKKDEHEIHISKKNVFKNKIAIDITDKYSDRKQVVSNLYGFLTNFVGNTIISIDDTEINNEIIDFSRYMAVSPYFYSKEESLNILSQELSKLEYIIKDNQNK